MVVARAAWCVCPIAGQRDSAGPNTLGGLRGFFECRSPPSPLQGTGGFISHKSNESIVGTGEIFCNKLHIWGPVRGLGDLLGGEFLDPVAGLAGPARCQLGDCPAESTRVVARNREPEDKWPVVAGAGPFPADCHGGTGTRSSSQWAWCSVCVSSGCAGLVVHGTGARGLAMLACGRGRGIALHLGGVIGVWKGNEISFECVTHTNSRR